MKLSEIIKAVKEMILNREMVVENVDWSAVARYISDTKKKEKAKNEENNY